MPVLRERFSVACSAGDVARRRQSDAENDNTRAHGTDRGDGDDDDVTGWVQLMLLRVDRLGVDEIYAFAGSSLHVIDCAFGRVVDRATRLHDGSITCALLRGEFLITGAPDARLKVWTTGKGRYRFLVHVLVGHTDAITALTAHPEPALFISASLDNTVRCCQAFQTFAHQSC